MKKIAFVVELTLLVQLCLDLLKTRPQLSRR